MGRVVSCGIRMWQKSLLWYSEIGQEHEGNWELKRVRAYGEIWKGVRMVLGGAERVTQDLAKRMGPSCQIPFVATYTPSGTFPLHRYFTISGMLFQATSPTGCQKPGRAGKES